MSGDNESHGVSTGRLRSFVERVERLEGEKADISEAIKEVFAEMKAEGFDIKAVKEIIKLRKEDPSERQEKEAILDVYKSALGIG